MIARPVLVVDDNPANVKLMTFVLSSSGYDVRSATTAGEALVSIEECMPALILMDLQLPGMDGLTLTRKLRADPRMRDLVIIAVTAYAMTGDRERALDAGCDDYISKPIDKRVLRERIAEFFGKRRRTERQ